jgi:hypothetical protein
MYILCTDGIRTIQELVELKLLNRGHSTILGPKPSCEIVMCIPGLPDGIFSNRKSQFGSILEGLRLENIGMYILWQFLIFYGNLV